MTKILFIGNFLSKKRGTVSPSELIITRLGNENFSIIKSSSCDNKLIRFLDIVTQVGFRKYSKIHIDVFSGNAFLFTVASVLIATFKGRSIVLTLHGGKLPEYYSSNKGLVNFVLKKAGLIQSPSQLLKYFFERQGYHVSYLPNPIPMELFPYNRVNVKQYSLLWVRAFTSIYNPEVPIMILEGVVEKFPEARLTMIGPDKGDLAKVKKLTKALNLSDKVTFTGPIPNRQLYNYYQTHHVYLNTTSYESFGVAVVEAAACGIPIVSNRVGEIPFIWTNQENILLVENNDIEKYIDHISFLFKNQENAQEMSIRARRIAEKFDWENIRLTWKNLLSGSKT